MSSFSEKQKQFKEQAAHEAIYEATLKVVSRQQGDTPKMQDIAETAGIATGTLYNYFKNKVELLTFVDDKLRQTVLKKIKQVTASNLPADEKLRSVTMEIFSFCRAHRIFFDLAEQFDLKARIPRIQKENGLNQARGCFARILSEGIQQQRFRQVETTMTSKHIFSTIVGTIEIQKWLQDYEMSKEADELTDFFLSYLKM
ncbi:MAG: TetR/AcrR family transcriptional regulator [Phycisphaerae bacterium]|nr:TetR/AcrR family transcriptional regulator [Phycisphaerae bacterium]